MKKKLIIRFALLIFCAFSINTAFAQDVRQKPFVKKQTTTTTKQTSAKKKQVTTHKWKEQRDFYEGLANVKDANDKWGYIDKTGKVVVK